MIHALLFVLLFFIIVYFCFRTAYYVSPRWVFDPYRVSSQEAYQVVKEEMFAAADYVLAQPFEAVTIQSRDGLSLFGRYYEQDPEAPVVIAFHGYRSGYMRDCSGIFRFAWERGLNVLLPDMRAHGESQGRVISLGVKERFDCLDWVDYVIKRRGPDCRIALSGCSMGSATVMMAAEFLPPQVKGMACDCGYSAPRDILSSVCQSMGLPAKPAYFLLRLAARIFGGFDPESANALDSLRKSSTPIFLAHGEGDTFVPCSMSRENYEASAAPFKLLLTVPEAEHGLSFMIDPEAYRENLIHFLRKTDIL